MPQRTYLSEYQAMNTIETAGAAMLQFFQGYGDPPEECMPDFLAMLDKRVYQKGEFLLHAGSIENHLSFVESGLLRGVHYLNGREITTWFGLEGRFWAAYHSFIGRVPSMENVEAIEPTTVYRITYSNLQSFYAAYPVCEHLGRKIAEQCFVDVSNRLMSMQFATAQEKYNHLQQTNPEIIRRAPLGYIAQYLGITQETLSRVRAIMA